MLSRLLTKKAEADRIKVQSRADVSLLSDVTIAKKGLPTVTGGNSAVADSGRARKQVELGCRMKRERLGWIRMASLACDCIEEAAWRATVGDVYAIVRRRMLQYSKAAVSVVEWG